MAADETGQILGTGIIIAQIVFGDNVINQLHWITEWLIAPFAWMNRSHRLHRLHRLNGLAGVEEHVLVQIRLLTVRFIADGASILFLCARLVRVDFHVHGQAGRLRERFITLLASEGTFAGVYSHVCVERARLREMLVTETAREWLFAGVIFHVLHQLRRLGERITAY